MLNAKDYGIPQNRERVFVVSILGEHEPYEFPEPVELELRLKDILEDEVDEKFYLSDERVSKLTFNWDKVKKNTVSQVGQYDTKTRNNSNRFRTYSPEGIGASLTTMGGGGLEPCIALEDYRIGGRGHYTIGVKMNRNEVKGEQDIANTLLARDYKGFGNQDMNGVVIAASRGRNPENPSDRTVGSPTEQRLEINKQGTSNTITTVQKDNYVLEGIDVHPFSKKLEFCDYKQKEISPCLLATDYKAPKTILESQTNSLRIRKLTPKECWRLMGCSDEDFHKAEQVNSNSQLYKQAGNAIVVDVLEGIFSKLFGGSK